MRNVEEVLSHPCLKSTTRRLCEGRGADFTKGRPDAAIHVADH